MVSANDPESRLTALGALLCPALADLATRLGTTPLQLDEWLNSAEVASRIASLGNSLDTLATLNALNARAASLASCQSLLSTEDPIERRRIAIPLLRATSPRPGPSPRRGRRPLAAPAAQVAEGDRPAWPGSQPGAADSILRELIAHRAAAALPPRAHQPHAQTDPAPTDPPGQRGHARRDHPAPPPTADGHLASPRDQHAAPILQRRATSPAAALLAAAGAPARPP